MSRKTRLHSQARQQQGDEIEIEIDEALSGDLPEDTGEIDELASEHARIQALTGEQDDDTPSPEEDPYEVLQRQFDDMKAERDAVERQRAAEQNRIRELESGQASAAMNELQSHKLIVEHAMSGTAGEIEDAKRAYRTAREAGDIDAELAATEALSDAKDKLRQLQEGHAVIQKRLEAPQPRQQRAAPAADPVEAVIVANFPNPRDQAWLRKNKQDIFGSEDRKQLAQAGHAVATLKHGIKPGTDEYYSFLDEHMGYEAGGSQQTPVAETRASPAPVRKKPVTSAPPSRVSSPTNKHSDRASPEIKALADDLGISVSEYQENQRKISEGRTHHRFEKA